MTEFNHFMEGMISFLFVVGLAGAAPSAAVYITHYAIADCRLPILDSAIRIRIPHLRGV
jgi:hypothetical protein